MGPRFDDTAATPGARPGSVPGTVEQRHVICAESGEERQVLAADQHVDAVDLDDADPVQNPLDVAHRDRPGPGTGIREALGPECDPSGLGCCQLWQGHAANTSGDGCAKLGCMDAPLLITIGLMIFIAALTAGLWARSRAARPVVGGIGFLLVPLGLQLSGVMDLIYNGILSIIDWANRTVWDNLMTWGASLLGVGIVLIVVASFLKPKPRQPKAQKAPKAAGGPAAQPAVGGPASGTPAQPRAKAEPHPEDDEIEAILRKRGIM